MLDLVHNLQTALSQRIDEATWMSAMLIKGEYSVKQFNPKVLFSPALLGAFVAAPAV